MPLVLQPHDQNSNKTKCLTFVLQEKHPGIARVIVHQNKDIPLPTHRANSSWPNKVHMQQLCRTLGHDIGQGWMGSGYHLAMPTWSTDQILLKLQLWQSSDKVKTTQAGNQIKAQVTQPPMPFPQITRRPATKQRAGPKEREKSALII
jgi:hypothetical protein